MKGQVAIIVLLVSAIMLTLGLTMSKKETTDIKIATNEELLKKAFDAAESGIQYYLGTGATNYTSPGNGSFARITATDISSGSVSINFDEFTPTGSSETYWLVDHLFDGSLGSSHFAGPSFDVCSSVGYDGSIKVDYFYQVGANFGLSRYGYNFAGSPGILGFTNAGSNCVTISTRVPAVAPVLVAVTPIFSGGKFTVNASNGGFFPSQGVDIVSEGQAGGTQIGVSAQSTKKLNVRKRYKVPGFMLSGILAEGSVLSN